MPDNTTLNSGTGGDVIATDDIGGVKYPRSKIVIGADGTNDGDVSATNPMPIRGTGLAGTANSGVITVQGIASMTPVQIADNGGSVTVDAAVGAPVFVRLSDGASAITALPVTDNGGSLTVDGTVAVSGTVTIAGAVTNAGTFAVQVSAALPAGTNAIGKLAANSGVVIGAVEIAAAQTLATVTNLSQLGGVAIAMGTGVRSAGTQRVTIATDDVVPVSQSGTWTVQPGNTANTTAWLVSDRPATAGGLSMSSFLSTAAVQSTAIKASAGQVYSMEFFNIGSTPMYVRLYNQTTAPGSGDGANIVWRGMIPGNTAGAGFVKTWDKGLEFSTGIGMRCSGGIADNDATALAANTIIGNVGYK